MKLALNEGMYVIAVSGGVDSMVLLDLFARTYKDSSLHKAVVAHVNHGIREEATADELLVKKTADELHIPFMYTRLHLSADASEAVAREKRYEFLRHVSATFSARAIITAHHADDLLETILLHLRRGTARHGLSPMTSNADVLRPLLHVSKQQILEYARIHAIKWHEDSTNIMDRYTRNRIRMRLKTASEGDKKKLLKMSDQMMRLNAEADALVELVAAWVYQGNEFMRSRFVLLDDVVAREVVAYVCKTRLLSYDTHLIHRMVHHIKTAQTGKKADLSGGVYLLSKKTTVEILQK